MPFTACKHTERKRHRDRKNIYYDFMRFGDSSTQPPEAVNSLKISAYLNTF